MPTVGTKDRIQAVRLNGYWTEYAERNDRMWNNVAVYACMGSVLMVACEKKTKHDDDHARDFANAIKYMGLWVPDNISNMRCEEIRLFTLTFMISFDTGTDEIDDMLKHNETIMPRTDKMVANKEIYNVMNDLARSESWWDLGKYDEYVCGQSKGTRMIRNKKAWWGMEVAIAKHDDVRSRVYIIFTEDMNTGASANQ